MRLRMDRKHRLTFPAKLAPTYDEDEDKFIVKRVKRKKSWQVGTNAALLKQ